jgi:choline dehydrogenase-like flavoprotein
MIRRFAADLGNAPHDVCVIGAGPVGITTALELARHGRGVVLLESGLERATQAAQRLSDATLLTPQHHAPMAIAVERALGGTSNLWGGRCVPLDPVDFAPRDAVPGSGWPLDAAALAPFLPAACDYARCGPPRFAAPLPGRAIADHDFAVDSLERWSAAPRFGAAHRARLHDSGAITVALGATVAGLVFAADGRVEAALVCGGDGSRCMLRAGSFVLAAGGLESTRLLLAAQAAAPRRFGGEEGPLGRYYMGHIAGGIAGIEITDPALNAALDYFADGGAYARRRFTPSPALQAREGLANIALWPEFPPLYDPAHGNGVLSLGYLVLSVPPLGRRLVAEAIRLSHTGVLAGAPIDRMPHIANLVRGLPAAARFVPRYLYRRYLARPRLPGFFQIDRRGRYALRYHAEHAPHRDSRVSLSGERDATGLPRLAIDLRFHRADAESIVRAHRGLAGWLARTGLGRLVWPADVDPVAEVLRQSHDGHHQIGTIRMAANDRAGVVDPDCRVFGSANLFVAGSAVFPSSSQANPTLTALVLAIRLADHLARTAPRPA